MPSVVRDDRGLALIEFAMTLPILLLLYLGGWQVSDAIACNRKVTITARALADLTSQYSSISSTEINSILNASQQIMAPYSTTTEMVRISELYTDNTGVTRVVWSYPGANNGIALTQNSIVTINTNLKTNGAYLIMGEAQYSYTPVVLYGLYGPTVLSETIFMSPRVSNSVDISS